MKAFIAALMLLGLSLTASAQRGSSRGLTPRIEIGLNVSNVADSYNVSPKVGLRLGGALEFDLVRWRRNQMGLYLTPGLYYATGGYVNNYTLNTYTLTTHQLISPLKVGFRINFARDWSAAIEGGIYGTYRLSATGKTGRYTETNLGVLEVNRFDFGLTESILVSYKRFFFSLGAELGLVEADGLSDGRWIAFHTTIGMRF